MKVALTSGTDAFVYVLAEHKSTPDPALPLQLASYMVRIWKRCAGTKTARLRALPPIIPVVVYHGAEPWTVPDSLRDMIATDDPDLAFLPGAGYILRNLRAMEIDALSRNAALRAGFITLRQEALAFLAEIAGSLPEGTDLRRQVLEYVLRVYNVDQDSLRATLRTGGHNELEALMGTIAETLLEQGEARGLAWSGRWWLAPARGVKALGPPRDRLPVRTGWRFGEAGCELLNTHGLGLDKLAN